MGKTLMFHCRPPIFNGLTLRATAEFESLEVDSPQGRCSRQPWGKDRQEAWIALVALSCFFGVSNLGDDDLQPVKTLCTIVECATGFFWFFFSKAPESRERTVEESMHCWHDHLGRALPLVYSNTVCSSILHHFTNFTRSSFGSCRWCHWLQQLWIRAFHSCSNMLQVDSWAFCRDGFCSVAMRSLSLDWNPTWYSSDL